MTDTNIQGPSIQPAHLGLISRIYDLPLQPENWQPVLDEFTDAMGAYGASVHTFDPIYAEHRASIYTSNYEPTLAKLGITIDDYNARFAQHDQVASTNLALMKERRFVADIDLQGIQTIEDYRQHPPIKFFQTFSGVNHRAASRLTLNGAWSDLIALQFANERDRISPQEIQIGSFFLDHFAKSVELGRAFGVLKNRFNGVFTALDRFHIGIFVLSPNGSVVVKNLEAERLLEAGDGLALSREGRLHPTDEEQRGALSDAIAKAAQTALGEDNRAESLLTLQRRSGKDPYLVEVAPIRDRDEIESQFGGCLVFVIDPTKTDVVSTEGMQTLYGLTGSEAEICKLVAQGQETRDVADERNLTLETTRTYIKQILQKTGAKNRAQLVRLALNVNLPIDPTDR